MTMRKVVTGLLVISLGICTLPAAAETSSDTFKASVDRAIASTAKEATKEAGAATDVRRAIGLRASKGPVGPGGSVAFASGPEAGQAGAAGGGMSKVSLIMTIVGTAAGAAGTYYMVKQLKKIQTNPPGSNGQ